MNRLFTLKRCTVLHMPKAETWTWTFPVSFRPDPTEPAWYWWMKSPDSDQIWAYSSSKTNVYAFSHIKDQHKTYSVQLYNRIDIFCGNTHFALKLFLELHVLWCFFWGENVHSKPIPKSYSTIFASLFLFWQGHGLIHLRLAGCIGDWQFLIHSEMNFLHLITV